MYEYTPEKILNLKENEVFVFGSNASGFHGAGASGYACRGVFDYKWREDKWFLNAMNSPMGSSHRIGRWAVYGVARGFQQGRDGASYAIETIKRPVFKRSTSLIDITSQISQLYEFAKTNPQKIFLVTKIGSQLAGYSVEEIRHCFTIQKEKPQNIILPKEYLFFED